MAFSLPCRPGEQRLFVAVGFSPAMKRFLLGEMARLRQNAVGGSDSPIENMHLTLAFIGETAKVDAAKAALASVRFASFSITVEDRQFGCFPGKDGKTLWIGVGEGREALCALADAVATALREHGFRLETRPFAPHITLARRVRQWSAPAPMGHRASMQVREITLFRSEQDSHTHKMRYTPIATQRLL